MQAMKRNTRQALFGGVAATLFVAGIRTWLYLGVFGKFPPAQMGIEIAFWLLLGVVVFLFQYKA